MNNSKTYSHRLRWILEPLEGLPGYIEKMMFGCLACYVRGRLSGVLASGQEPWNGFLLPTEREHHETLIVEFPSLSPHPVLGKWLYVSEDTEDFEETVTGLVEAVLNNDMRVGVEPKPRKPKGLKKRSKKGEKTG